MKTADSPETVENIYQSTPSDILWHNNLYSLLHDTATELIFTSRLLYSTTVCKAPAEQRITSDSTVWPAERQAEPTRTSALSNGPIIYTACSVRNDAILVH
jgi:hypothetical protein